MSVLQSNHRGWLLAIVSLTAVFGITSLAVRAQEPQLSPGVGQPEATQAEAPARTALPGASQAPGEDIFRRIEGPRLEGPAVRGPQAHAWLKVDFQPYFPSPGEAERRILAALAEKTQVEFINTPLVDAVQFMTVQSDIPVIIDVVSLEDAGIPADEPVSVTLAGVSLRSALKIILGDIGLTWVVEDEVLKITTKEAAAKKEMTRVYPVGDLVSPTDEDSWSELAEAVQTSVLNGHWQSVDGTGGTVSTVRSARALVIRQTQDAHDQIVKLLTSLRRLESSGAELICWNCYPRVAWNRLTLTRLSCLPQRQETTQRWPQRWRRS
jgi:hypothetical protein